MKKKTVALLALASMCVTSFALAAPMTSFEKGQTQVDLGAWDPKAEVDFQDYGSIKTDKHWNFAGGLTYGMTDRWGLQYAYYGLKTDADNMNQANDSKTNLKGNEQEVNLIYSLSKTAALYGGWNRIHTTFEDDNINDSQTNNVAQLGVILRAPFTDKFQMYAKGALGTKKTSVWEAGFAYSATKDLDINAGYRYVNTKLEIPELAAGMSDRSLTYKGFIAGLSLRFGGPSAPAPVVEEPAPAPVVETPAPHVYKDYYVESIHFDFDIDTPMASEQSKLDNFVNVAKANPTNVFKLVGNTDAKGTDSYNNDLSKRRVLNVGNYAISKGVPAAQLQATYRGKTDPVSTNDTEQGRADNRRVDIFMHK